MKIAASRTAIVIAALISATSSAAQAQDDEERITDYHADVTVEPSGDLRVVETIAIIAQGKAIRRGIFREFPTSYDGKLGQRHTVGLQLEGVSRDGAPEPYRTETKSNGVAVYIGRDTQFLTHGPHTYEIRYRTTKQLGHFGNRDELYWNVTGNGWRLPMDAVSATVSLPAGATITKTGAWTGERGSEEQAATIETNGAQATFRTTRSLREREGLTIAVTWPAGFVARTSTKESLLAFLRDDRYAIALGIGFLVIALHGLLSYALARRRDNPIGTEVSANPPGGLSPAALRMVEGRSFDNAVFAAGVASLVAKGHATLDATGPSPELRRATDGTQAPLASEEQVLYRALLGQRESVKLASSERELVVHAMKRLEEALLPIAEAHYREDHRPMARAVLLLVVTMVVSIFQVQNRVPVGGVTFFALIMVALTVVFTTFFVTQAARAFTQANAGVGIMVVGGFFWLIITAFTGGLVYALSDMTSPLGGILFVACILATVMTRFLRRLRHPRGRAVHALTSGFRKRLEANAVDLSPALAGAYALALGLTDDPGLGDLESGHETSRFDTREPLWLHHRRIRRRRAIAGVTLTSAIDAASRSPGSSSAFSSSSSSSSSGSSGGGGGGGGGGGW